MDKERFFKEAGFRHETYGDGNVKFTIRELTLAERRAVMEAKDMPPEAVAALTVAFSCPDFTEDDVQRLIDEVRPDILLNAAARIYQLSGMTKESINDIKKPSAGQRLRSLFAWRWPWGKQYANSNAR